MNSKLSVSLVAWAIAIAAAASATGQDIVAVKASKILPVSGPAIDDGVVLMQNGRIVKIGKASEVEVPWSAKVIDATGKTVMPTWVLAHSQSGQRGMNDARRKCLGQENVLSVVICCSATRIATFDRA